MAEANTTPLTAEQVEIASRAVADIVRDAALETDLGQPATAASLLATAKGAAEAIVAGMRLLSAASSPGS